MNLPPGTPVDEDGKPKICRRKWMYYAHAEMMQVPSAGILDLPANMRAEGLKGLAQGPGAVNVTFPVGLWGICDGAKCPLWIESLEMCVDEATAIKLERGERHIQALIKQRILSREKGQEGKGKKKDGKKGK